MSGMANPHQPEHSTYPDTFLGLVAVIGEDAALALCRVFGGQKVFIPRPENVSHTHRFATTIGIEAARDLARWGASSLVYLPRLAAIERARRNRRIAAERDAGASIAELCTRYVLSDRQISSILKSEQPHEPTERTERPGYAP